MARQSAEKNNNHNLAESPASFRIRDHLPSAGAQVIFWSIFAVSLALDLWSKHAVFEWIRQRHYRSIEIINGTLRFVTAENPGAAFGLAHGQTAFLVGVSVIALVLVLLLFYFGRFKNMLNQIAMALITAGVTGNLWDRIFNDGRVRDFIDVRLWQGRHWPTFNVADSILCIGVALLILEVLFTGQSDQERAQQQK